MSRKCAVFVNLNANNGRAARRWGSIATAVPEHLPAGSNITTFHPPFDIAPLVKARLEEGYRYFVSAGGDGSINNLLNHLLWQTGGNIGEIVLGGIGLGSSNDFIKPQKHFIHGLPVRLDWDHATVADVGKAAFMPPEGVLKNQYFIANASVGITAQANWLFNHGDWILRHTKGRWTNLAILYTALRTILTFQNFSGTLLYNGRRQVADIANLAVLKSTYVSGSFHFDDPVQPDDGLLGINICLDMRKTELLRTLIGLAKGHFQGRSKTQSMAVKELALLLASPMALEMDGEVFMTDHVTFSVLPGAIHLMGL